MIFNRLETTRQVFDRIRTAKPQRLFVAADGPRANEQDELRKCDAVRQFVLQSIDWPCDVRTLFREKNLGCKYAVSGAIKWFFENVECGIVLEDDCLPSLSFFNYCETLLHAYGEDPRIGMISGHNYFGVTSTKDDYSFVTTCGVWGWASWRRTIRGYDPDYSVLFDNDIRSVDTICFRKSTAEVLLRNALCAAKGEINTWDYQFCEHLITHGMLTAIPSINLVRNIGFTSDSTHTAIVPEWYRDESYDFSGPVRIADRVKVSRKLSERIEALFTPHLSFRRRIGDWVRKHS